MQRYSLFQAVKINVRFAAPCLELSASHYILFPLSSQIDRMDKNVADIYPHKIRVPQFLDQTGSLAFTFTLLTNN